MLRSAISRLVSHNLLDLFKRDQRTPDVERALEETFEETGIDDQPKKVPKVGEVEFYQQLGPPNLELNFAFDHTDDRDGRRHSGELIGALISAIILQTGLLVFAILTVAYSPLRDRIGFDPEIYGLPCYLGGSVLLSLGVGLCSYVVERKTTEYAWVLAHGQAPTATTESTDQASQSQASVDEYPLLVYVQKNQVVNDQKFDSYILLAGRKREVIASTRKADTASDAIREETSGKATESRGPATDEAGGVYSDSSGTGNAVEAQKHGTPNFEALKNRESF